ncbi:MAG: TRAP transporter large permease subunit [Alphaproteobacteria bacterium]|nr:TRAP transporter large permease subunit [Alphaproteobacteria bacterium]
MLGLIVAAIMMGFPTAFTLMGMGMIFGFVAFWDPAQHWWENRVFDLMVQRTFGAMNNDTLISIPLFVFMGYLIERAALVDKMFRSVQLAFRRLPASLAVTTLMVCAFWGMASGIVGAVVVLMGVIALRPMLNAGYDVRLASGAITAGGTLGILIPPSVMLIVYAAVAGQSIVKLYAAAMLPGFFLAFMYIVYIMARALIDPKLAPALPAEMYRVDVPGWIARLESGPQRRVLGGLLASAVLPGRLKGATTSEGGQVAHSLVVQNALAALVPAILVVALFSLAWWFVLVRNAPDTSVPPPVVQELGVSTGQPAGAAAQDEEATELGTESQSVVEDSAVPVGGITEPSADTGAGHVPEGFHAWFWGLAAAFAALLLIYYWRMDGEQLEILKMLVTSVVPLAVLTVSVLGAILFGITTATESAGIGSIGAMFLAGMQKYRRLSLWASLAGAIFGASLGSMRGDIMTIVISGVLGALFAGTAAAWLRDILTSRQLVDTLKQSTFLTAKTTAMVCWLFVGSALFSAVFALHGGQQLIEQWVLSLDLSPLMFMILAQAIIFLLGWPLEWTEIIVIFVPIFIPLLSHFNVDPVLFGTMVAVNLQAAFLSPPVAMSAFYLKGVAPKHVTLNQIFAGMMPYMFIVVLCLVIMYLWPGMTLMLPRFLYGG